MMNKVKQYFNKVLNWKKWGKKHTKLVEAIKLANDLLTDYENQQKGIENSIYYYLQQFERDINIYAKHRISHYQQFCLQDKARIETIFRFVPKHIIDDINHKYNTLNDIYLGLLKPVDLPLLESEDIQF